MPAICRGEKGLWPIFSTYAPYSSNAKKATVFKPLPSFGERGSWQFHTSVERQAEEPVKTKATLSAL